MLATRIDHAAVDDGSGMSVTLDETGKRKENNIIIFCCGIININ